MSNERTKLQITIGIVGVFILLPIWYFLLHTILSELDVDRLVWFLFWIYVPLGFIFQILNELVKDR